MAWAARPRACCLLPAGRALAAAFPQAAVVSVRAPQRSDLGSGFQWFSVAGITEDSRPARIAAAMPLFEATVQGWQQRTGVAVADTVLVGFSQGAIMALESTQRAAPLSGRVVSLSGRFAHDPRLAPADTTLHFVHGTQDRVIHHGYAEQAAETLALNGANVTVDVVPGLGHQIDAQVLRLLVERLQGQLPRLEVLPGLLSAHG